MSEVLILNGSGRGKKSTSAGLGIYLIDLLKEESIAATMLTIRNQLNSEEKIKEMVDAISEATHIIVIAPLYDDCQPYNVVKAQEIIAESKMNLENKHFLFIANSGFGEPEQITEGTLRIYKKFASSVGFRWGGSLSIGGGEMLQGRYGKLLHEVGTFAKNAIVELEKIVNSIKSESTYPDTEIILIPGFFYKWPFKQLFTSMNTRGWKKVAAKNGEKVDAKPFL
ncbi:MAG: hypothetical protein KGD64_12955 [Candidatus Heimdallarchaeota archaeon]|nr:hypothetical protein [Candidatus Heimdallarchaeota archaeon]